ncbi:hypothetical protein [Vibrio neptunius]|uniref:Uncharacterized protein n=1 Tax=Vibrio neptunius TaxID=170651 RepID=A0ABS3A4Q2_9VIBR|nr:hypothetical protein [Vibrio neptunius]KJY85976.1 hypothetical protein TW84_20875 [Vibrio neptunius]MBN3494248.1 hypothetical protein [Vibrio neptunius]MBN3516652.1 hypothetical protein [Vibrio neptunius]MBN3550861.1 hypothetical protein [Vibrio neptunius]MBN3578990.1 hypothetical protein [Vibrio neptunius]
MAKRLCKMNRKQIADGLNEIHRLVVAPKFVCRSCVRSSADKASLCKPAAIPPQQCQNKPIEQQRACGLLAEALPSQDTQISQLSEQKSQAVRRVLERVKEKAQPKVSTAAKTTADELTLDLSDKKAIKKAKKALKKQYKQQKKLLKLVKKQHKLQKHEARIKAQLSKKPALSLSPEQFEPASTSNMH